MGAEEVLVKKSSALRGARDPQTASTGIEVTGVGFFERTYMRCFTLLRIEDATGVSGTGIVARGIEWSDKSVSMRWLGETPSFVNYEGGIKHVMAVHGHHGKTAVHFCIGEAGCPYNKGHTCE